MSGKKGKGPGYMFFDEETEAQEVPKLECKRSWTRDPILQAPGTDTASEENRHQSEGITCHPSPPWAPQGPPEVLCAHRPHPSVGRAKGTTTGIVTIAYTLLPVTIREERGWTRLLQPRRWDKLSRKDQYCFLGCYLQMNQFYLLWENSWLKKEALYSGQVALSGLEWSFCSSAGNDILEIKVNNWVIIIMRLLQIMFFL